MRYAGVTPRTDYRDGFTAARVKRIEDPNLNRRTPGSMTLLREANEGIGCHRSKFDRIPVWQLRNANRRGDAPIEFEAYVSLSHLQAAMLALNTALVSEVAEIRLGCHGPAL